MGLRLKLIVVVIINVFLNFDALALVQFKNSKISLIDQSGKAKIILVELAESNEQHEQGLMFRKKLKPNQGMLFVFSNEDIRNFWMKNTLIDLSIGYFNKDKKLIDIQEMKSVTSILQVDLPSYPSKLPAQFALEMDSHWFSKNNIKEGSVFKFVN